MPLCWSSHNVRMCSTIPSFFPGVAWSRTRFKDDILIVVDGPKDRWKKWLQALFRCAAPFKLLCVSISRVCNFLDLTISIGDNGRISYEIFQKPTSLATPLSHESFHAPFVHPAWPLAQVRRFERCSRSKIAARVATQSLVDWLKQEDPGHPAIPIIPLGLCGRSQITNQKKKASKFTSRIIMPWHPSFRRCIGIAAQFDATISWLNGSRHWIKVLSTLRQREQTDTSKIWFQEQVG